MTIPSRATEVLGDFLPMVFAQLENSARGVRRLRAHFDDAAQEEREPPLEVASVPHRLEKVIVLLTVPLEIVRQVEHRLAQRGALTQEKRDQKSAHAAVAVEERVDRFKLRV